MMKPNKEIRLSEKITDKLVAIGDVHGLTTWRKVIDAQPAAEKPVFHVGILTKKV